MNNIAIPLVLLCLAIVGIVFGETIAKYLTQQYVNDLKRRDEPESEITQKKEKLEKELRKIFYWGGWCFFIISAILLALEFFYPFPETKIVETSAPTNSILKSIWDFAGWILFIGIFLYVLEWYGFFKWPWRGKK